MPGLLPAGWLAHPLPSCLSPYASPPCSFAELRRDHRGLMRSKQRDVQRFLLDFPQRLGQARAEAAAAEGGGEEEEEESESEDEEAVAAGFGMRQVRPVA